MTVLCPVVLDFQERANGVNGQAVGIIEFVPSRWDKDGNAYVAPKPVYVAYLNTPVTVNLAVLPNGAAWYVNVDINDEQLNLCVAPQSAVQVNLTDLPNIDRDTLGEIEAEAAWYVALDDAMDIETAARDAADIALQALIVALNNAYTLAIATKIDKPATPPDSYQLAWNNTLGQWVAVAPSGGRRVAQAKVVSGGVVNIPGNGGVGVITTIPNTAISVTAADSAGRPVSLKYRATGYQTIVGTGTLYLMLYETTGGGNVQLTSHAQVLPNSLASGLFVITFPIDDFDLGVVNSTRTFELRAQIYTASGVPSASFINSAAGPTVLKAVTE